MKEAVLSLRFRAGLDLPSAFLLMADEKTVGLTFDYGPLCSDSCLCQLPACRLSFRMAESSRRLCNGFFLPGALLGRALHRVPVAVISWELSSSSSGRHHTITA